MTIVFGSTLPAVPGSTAVTFTLTCPGKTVNPTRSACGTVTALRRPEADAGIGADDAAGRDGVGAQEVEVREADRARRRGLLDPLAGGRERVADGHLHGEDVGRDDAGGGVGLRRVRVGRDHDPQRIERLRPRGDHDRGRWQHDVRADAPDEEDEPKRREHDHDRQARSGPRAGTRPGRSRRARGRRPGLGSRTLARGRVRGGGLESGRVLAREVVGLGVCGWPPQGRWCDGVGWRHDRRSRGRRGPGRGRSSRLRGAVLGGLAGGSGGAARRRGRGGRRGRRVGGASRPSTNELSYSATLAKTGSPAEAASARVAESPATTASCFSLIRASRDSSRKLIRDVATREPYGRTSATRRPGTSRIRAAAEVISSSTSR